MRIVGVRVLTNAPPAGSTTCSAGAVVSTRNVADVEPVLPTRSAIDAVTVWTASASVSAADNCAVACAAPRLNSDVRSTPSIATASEPRSRPAAPDSFGPATS